MEGLPELPPEFECLPYCKCEKHETDSKPDRRLQLWESNQEKSDRVRKYLCKVLERSSNELLMNSLEKYRKIQEQRTLTTYAQVPCKFDKYRGNPTWWIMPPRLRKICDEPQEYFLHRTRLERMIVPQLEYIHTPKLYHQKLPKVSKSKTLQDEYILKRLDSFCLKKIQPHIPDLDSVYLLGESLKSASKDAIKREDILQKRIDLSETSENKFKSSIPCSDKPSLTYLLINDQKIKSDSTGIIKTSIIFDLACENDTKMSYLLVENRSTWTLRISFQETKKVSTFQSGGKSISGDSKGDSHFFFDRNFKVIIPAQKVNIPFWFKTPKCGFSEQLLKMSVVPDLWHGNLSIHISLNASSTQADSFEKLKKYENMIQDRIRNRMIQDCLNQILTDIPRRESAIKIYTYDKGIIFEALNSTFDPVHDRPKYLYDKEIVDELESFYDSVRLEQHPEFWSLCINDLRVVTKDREAFERAKTLSENYDHVFETIEKNKGTRRQMQEKLDKMFLGDKSKKDKGDKSKDKASSGNAKPKKDKEKATTKTNKSPLMKGKKGESTKLTEPVRDEIPKTLTDHLEEIISKLRSPFVMKDVHCQRLKVAYNLFCSYMDKISSEVREMCQNYFSLKREDPLEIFRNTFSLSHMKCEQMRSCEMQKQAFFDFPKFRGTPQPAWALEIPMDDYQARFEAINSQADKKDKVKKKPSKTKLKSKSSKETFKKNEGSIKSKETKRTKSAEKQGSINFADDGTVVLEQEASFSGEIDENKLEEDWFYLIPHDKVDHYRNNIYTVFYKNLCDFADDIDLIFSMIAPDDEPSPAQIQKIKFSQTQDLLLDEGLQVTCVNLKQKLSELLRVGDVDELTDDYEMEMQARAKVRKQMQDQKKQDLIEKSSSSVWDVIKSYVPKRKEKEAEEEIVQDEEMEAETEALFETTELQSRTDRLIQTSLCSDITVNISDGLLPRDEPSKMICICGRAPNVLEVEKLVSSFHNSECFLSVASAPSSDDISSRDT